MKKLQIFLSIILITFGLTIVNVVVSPCAYAVQGGDDGTTGGDDNGGDSEGGSGGDGGGYGDHGDDGGEFGGLGGSGNDDGSGNETESHGYGDHGDEGGEYGTTSDNGVSAADGAAADYGDYGDEGGEYGGLDEGETPVPCICCCAPSCSTPVSNCDGACECQSNSETGETIPHNLSEFDLHEIWLIDEFWEAHILPAMMMMTNQMTITAMQQVQIIGTFFDAKHQLESQRLLQDLQAQAHKEYQPSTGMCRFGTNTKSLAASDRKAEFNQIALAARSTQRILMDVGNIGTGSARDDSRSRLVQFRTTYCNPADFGNALDLLCQGAPLERRNRDVDFTNNIQANETLEMDFTDETIPAEEEDVLALSANLYGNVLLPHIPQKHLSDREGNMIDTGAKYYMKTRALAAKRSVAFYSFAAQAAMRSQGGESVFPYMIQILESMGMDEEVIEATLKEAPSYNAQMELLTKRLYQHPNFYSDLYDKPANIDRKDTSMQAIALMQKRDLYRSQLRSEANMAVFLETLLDPIQEGFASDPDLMKEGSAILTNLGLAE